MLELKLEVQDWIQEQWDLDIMLIRPIPPVMMPNQIDYVEFQGADRYGKETNSTSVTIANVRVVPKSQLKYASTNETLDFNSLLFIDPHTSKEIDANGIKTELTIKPKEKDEIIFNGVTYIIINCNELFVDAGKLHHWECTLNRK